MMGVICIGMKMDTLSFNMVTKLQILDALVIVLKPIGYLRLVTHAKRMHRKGEFFKRSSGNSYFLDFKVFNYMAQHVKTFS